MHKTVTRGRLKVSLAYCQLRTATATAVRCWTDTNCLLQLRYWVCLRVYRQKLCFVFREYYRNRFVSSVCLSIYFSLSYLSSYLSILSICLSIYLSIVSIHLSIYLSIVSIYLICPISLSYPILPTYPMYPIYLSYLSILSIYPIYLSKHPSIYLSSICLSYLSMSICLSYLSSLSIYPYIYLSSIYLSIPSIYLCLSIYLPILSIYLSYISILSYLPILCILSICPICLCLSV